MKKKRRLAGFGSNLKRELDNFGGPIGLIALGIGSASVAVISGPLALIGGAAVAGAAGYATFNAWPEKTIAPSELVGKWVALETIRTNHMMY